MNNFVVVFVGLVDVFVSLFALSVCLMACLFVRSFLCSFVCLSVCLFVFWDIIHYVGDSIITHLKNRKHTKIHKKISHSVWGVRRHLLGHGSATSKQRGKRSLLSCHITDKMTKERRTGTSSTPITSYNLCISMYTWKANTHADKPQGSCHLYLANSLYLAVVCHMVFRDT